ncbi:universal stress protein [Bradyrhizobium sp. Ash2021]|uniref:universal stress protein n=1 Tax=Bradyrhizobium sp. Ash2021 TaxID=2954771 RepID=UPI0028162A0D|nr:universal stress protein [Bradyrhizobium sp. Ash2021]WMT78068.1 universal stress protein [Bradyrhizobium sp. Ash2021]
MKYATVMVGMALGQPNDSRLEIAAQLAERFGARVIGVAAAEFTPPLYFTEGEPAQRLIDQGWAAVKNRLAALEGEFRAAMQNRAAELEWRCAEDFPTRYVVRQARACDIIVVGEASRGALADPFAQVNPSDLVMQTGRPLLVVPETCDWLDLRSVLVAWKDTAEARRAVSDALPLLGQAKEVTVAEIVEDEADRPAALSRVGDVVAWLSRHGVRASQLVPEQRGDAATQLERIASDVGAGVVIAGAYGHSRLSEWILGGVTRRLINPSNRCSMLSH